MYAKGLPQVALLETKKELAECDSTEKHSASFFVMIKIGVALNSPNINTQYVLMSQLGDTGYALATNCFNTCFIIRSERTLLMVDAGGGKWCIAATQQGECIFV